MVEKVSGNNRMSSNAKSRKGGGRTSNASNKHLRSNKVQNSFNSTHASASLNWRDNFKNNVNESSNYGYNNHRLTSAFCMLIGLEVEVRKTDGIIYEGILETVSSKLEFHLSHARQKATDIQTGKETKFEDLNDKAIFPFCDIVYCKSLNVDLDFAKQDKRDILLTDSAISGSNGTLVEKELIQWQPEEGHSLVGSLDEDIVLNGATWGFDDMMKVNKEQHGVKSTYDSSLSNYMTPLVIRDDETYKEQERLAEKTAREMQNDAKCKEMEMVDSGMDEEEMFSSVARNVNSNDGFTTCTGKNFRSSRVGKSGQVVGPRLQQQRFNNRNQENTNHNSGMNHQSGSRSHVSVPPHRTNGNAPHTNSYQQQQTNNGPSHSSSSGLQSDASVNNQACMQNESIQNNATRTTLSYSAVAMKKQQQQAINNRMNVSPKPNIPPQPLMQQQMNLQSDEVNHQTTVTSNVHPQTVQMSNQSSSATIANAKQNTSFAQSVPNYPQATATQGQSTVQVDTSPQRSNSSPVTAALHSSPTQAAQQSLRPPRLSSVSDNSSQLIAAKKNATMDAKDRKAVASELAPKDRRNEEIKPGLSKFGKIMPAVEEEKKIGSIGEFKEFSTSFQLEDTKPKNTKMSPQKSAEVQNRPRSEEREAIIQPEVIEHVESVPVHKQDSVPPATSTAAVSVISASNTTASVATTTATVAEMTAVGNKLTSSLNPDAKEFSFNPAAKEFTPFMAKATVTKQIYTGVPLTIAQQQPPYYAVQPGTNTTVMVNQHGPHDTVLAQPMRQVKSVYRQPYHPSVPGATVFSIPAEFANNAGGAPQVITASQAGFIPGQSMAAQPPQFIFVPGPNGSIYQQMVPAPPQQQFMQMQPVRYVSHPGSSNMQQHSAARLPTNFQQDGVPPGNYVMTASQHQAAANQHPSYPAPSPTPSMQQPYVLNPGQSGNSYPQNTSPMTYTQGNSAPHFRPATSMHSESHHHPQQQSFVMMGHQQQHMAGVNMNANQGYVQGQQHDIYPRNYQGN